MNLKKFKFTGLWLRYYPTRVYRVDGAEGRPIALNRAVIEDTGLHKGKVKVGDVIAFPKRKYEIIFEGKEVMRQIRKRYPGADVLIARCDGAYWLISKIWRCTFWLAEQTEIRRKSLTT